MISRFIPCAATLIGAALCLLGLGKADAQLAQSRQAGNGSHPITYGPAIWRIGNSVPPPTTLSIPMVTPPACGPGWSPPALPGYWPPANSVVILPAYDTAYSFGSAPMEYYPSVFGLFVGEPAYFYAPAVYVSFDPDGNIVFQDIDSFTPYDFDPFSAQPEAVINPDSPFGEGVAEMLDDFATDWAMGDLQALESYLPMGSAVSIAVGNQYQYSVGAPAYLQLAGSFMQSIRPIDLRYTGVHVKPDGNALAEVVETYKDPSGETRTTNLSFAFSRDPSAPKGYRFSGFNVSRSP